MASNTLMSLGAGLGMTMQNTAPMLFDLQARKQKKLQWEEEQTSKNKQMQQKQQMLLKQQAQQNFKTAFDLAQDPTQPPPVRQAAAQQAEQAWKAMGQNIPLSATDILSKTAQWTKMKTEINQANYDLQQRIIDEPAHQQRITDAMTPLMSGPDRLKARAEQSKAVVAGVTKTKQDRATLSYASETGRGDLIPRRQQIKLLGTISKLKPKVEKLESLLSKAKIGLAKTKSDSSRFLVKDISGKLAKVKEEYDGAIEELTAHASQYGISEGLLKAGGPAGKQVEARLLRQEGSQSPIAGQETRRKAGLAEREMVADEARVAIEQSRLKLEQAEGTRLATTGAPDPKTPEGLLTKMMVEAEASPEEVKAWVLELKKAGLAKDSYAAQEFRLKAEREVTRRLEAENKMDVPFYRFKKGAIANQEKRRKVLMRQFLGGIGGGGTAAKMGGVVQGRVDSGVINKSKGYDEIVEFLKKLGAQ